MKPYAFNFNRVMYIQREFDYKPWSVNQVFQSYIYRYNMPKHDINKSDIQYLLPTTTTT